MMMPHSWVAGLTLASAVSARVAPEFRRDAPAIPTPSHQLYYNSTAPFHVPSYLPTGSGTAGLPSKTSSSVYTSVPAASQSFSASSGSVYAGSSSIIPTLATITSSSLTTVTSASPVVDSSSLIPPTGSTTASPVSSTCTGPPPLETFNIQYFDSGPSELDGQFAVLIEGTTEGALMSYTIAQEAASIFTLSPTGELVGIGFPSSNSLIANVEEMVSTPGSDTYTALLFDTELQLTQRNDSVVTERSACIIVDAVLTCNTGPNRVFYVDIILGPGTTPAIRVGPTVPAGFEVFGETLMVVPVFGADVDGCTD